MGNARELDFIENLEDFGLRIGIVTVIIFDL